MAINTQVVPYAPSTNAALATSLTNFSSVLRRSTEEALAQNPDWEEYSMTEQRAMVLVESLKAVNGVDLMAVQLRYSLINEIERTNALTAHPEHYSTLGAMATAQGISISELSKIKDLCGIVFPYLNAQGLPIADLWAKVGKAKFFEILPILKVLITGEESGIDRVNNQVNFLVGDAVATNLAAGIEVFDDNIVVTEDNQVNQRDVRHQVVENLLQDAELLPYRELVQVTRPDRTPSIQTLVINRNGHKYLVSQMDPGQFEMFQRRMTGHVDLQFVDLPEDRAQRQQLLLARREYRNVYDLIEG